MTSNRLLAALIATVLQWLTLAAPSASGQASQPEPCGFIRMFDAVSSGSGTLEFSIDAKPVRPQGYQLGNITGAIALKPNTYSVLFRREGVRQGATQVSVTLNATTILIPFAELAPARDGQPARWEIKILKLKQHPSDDTRTASFVSVSRLPELNLEIRQTDGKWQSLLVKRLGVSRTDIQQSRGYLPVRCNNLPLSPISVGTSGNFVSILFDDETNTLRSKTFQDYKYLSPD